MIPSSPCSTSEPCCVSLHDIAYHLLTEVYDALTECYPSDCVSPLRAYLTLGSGDDGNVDTLTVVTGPMVPTPNTTSGSAGAYKGTFTVRLLESGWPTARVDGDQIVMPQPEEQTRAARHVFAMGEAMHRRLAWLASNRALTPSSVRCSNSQLGSMQPISPSGGTVGWICPVTVTLPWN